MPYPYGMQNAPVVGNGLGGLPRRTTIPVTPVTPTVEPTYTFTNVGSLVNVNLGTSSAGCTFYFGDSNIFWVDGSSISYKYSLNRGTSTLTGTSTAVTFTQTNMALLPYSIIASSTLVGSPDGFKATYDGSTNVTCLRMVSLSGTTTIGAIAYTLFGRAFVRAIPNSTNYVLVQKQSTGSSNVVVFVLDNTFTIVKSFTSSMGGDYTITNCYMLDSSTLVIAFYRNDEGGFTTLLYGHTAVNIETNNTFASSGIFTQSLAQAASQSGTVWLSVLNRATNTFYSIGYMNDTNKTWLMPYHCSFNTTTQTFTHWNGTTGTQTGRAISNVSPVGIQFFNATTISTQLLGSIRILEINEYGNPYTRIIIDGTDSWSTLTLPYAAPNTTDPSDFTFATLTQPTLTGAYTVAQPVVFCRGKYQVNVPDSSGFDQSTAKGYPFHIGDNYYFMAQVRGNVDGFVYARVLRRVAS